MYVYYIFYITIHKNIPNLCILASHFQICRGANAIAVFTARKVSVVLVSYCSFTISISSVKFVPVSNLL